MVNADISETSQSNLNIKHQKWFRKDMGTENVAPFLSSFVTLVRPKRILEIGAGYTTPFLIEGIEKTKSLFIDNNFNSNYKLNSYDPKMVLLEASDISQIYDNSILAEIENIKFLEFINQPFQGKSNYLKERYGLFDFVWFDCGGPEEYKSFINE